MGTTAKTTATKTRAKPSGIKSQSSAEAAQERKQAARIAEHDGRIERLEDALRAVAEGNLANVRRIMDVDQGPKEEEEGA